MNKKRGKVVSMPGFENMKAPDVTNIDDTIIVLESMLRDLQKKEKNSNMSNKLAASIVGKSMNIDPDAFSGLLNAQDEERRMNMSALSIAIQTLKALPEEVRTNKL